VEARPEVSSAWRERPAPARAEAHGTGLTVGSTEGEAAAREFCVSTESGGSALRNLLAFITENPVTYAIVDKIDRWARNREVDALITRSVRDAGARLISAQVAIDETPAGQLLHGSWPRSPSSTPTTRPRSHQGQHDEG